MQSIQKRNIVLFILVWGIAFFLPLYFSPFYTQLKTKEWEYLLIIKLIGDLALAIFFYCNTQYYFPKWLKNKNTFNFLLKVFGWLIVLIILDYVLLTFWYLPNLKNLPITSFSKLPDANFRLMITPAPKLFGIIFYFIIALFASSVLQYNRYERLLQDDKKQLELEKLKAELEILRLQISPHFLFNTLNNIRALVRKKSVQSEDAIIRLSHLLRYMLYQSNADKVLLSNEIKHIQDYVELQKLRVLNADNIVFFCSVNADKIEIEPLLFIPFVENAFKYGILDNDETRIKIEFLVENKVLHFTVKNKYAQQPNDDLESNGIGIANVKKRLALYYPEKHTIEVNKSENEFEIKIKVRL